MNYLHHGLMNPDLMSLALFDTHVEAVTAFNAYLNEAMRIGMAVAKPTAVEYLFPEGGRLKFGVVSCAEDVLKYKGAEWHNVFVDKLDPTLRQHTIAHLFKPVYRGDRDVL